MGILLFEEVADWSPVGLTPNQRWGLGILARDANDATRVTYHTATHKEILRRVYMSAKQWEAVRGVLLKKGLLEPVEGGYRGMGAKYRIATMSAPCVVLDRRKTPQKQGAFAPRGTAKTRKGLESPPNFRGQSRQSPQNLGGQSPESPPNSGGPTPPSFSSTTPPPPVVPVPEQRLAAAPEAGGGGGSEAATSQEHKQAAAFVDGLRYDGQRPDGFQREALIELVMKATAAGWEERTLSSQIDPGQAPVQSRLAIYLYRLKSLPEAPRAGCPLAPLRDAAAPAKPRFRECSSCRDPIPTASPDGLCTECREGANT